jgi:hypothetical protein
VTHTDAVSQTFARLVEFLAGGRLTGVVASLERELSGTQAQEAAEAGGVLVSSRRYWKLRSSSGGTWAGSTTLCPPPSP